MIQNISNILLGINICQTSLTHYENSNHKLFALMFKVRNLLHVVNLSCIGLQLVQLGAALYSNKKINAFFTRHSSHFNDPNLKQLYVNLGFMIITIICIVYGIGINILVDRLNQSAISKRGPAPGNSLDNQINQSSTKVKWEVSPNQKIRQFCQMLQAANNIILLLVTRSSLYFALNAGIQLYQFAKLTQRKCLSIKYEFSSHTHPEWRIWRKLGETGLSKISALYYWPLFPSHSTQECTICLDTDIAADSYFDSHHTFHATCLTPWLAEQTPKLLNNSSDYTRIYHPAKNSRDDYITYSVEIPEADLPNCPNCRERPLFNELKLYAEDFDFKLGQTTRLMDVTWVKD